MGQKNSQLSSDTENVTQQNISKLDPMSSNPSNDNNEDSRKRFFPNSSNEATEEPWIKYRRVHNTCPWMLLDDFDDYCHKTEPNQLKEQDIAMQADYVRDAQAPVTIDLCDIEDQYFDKENNMNPAAAAGVSMLPASTEPERSSWETMPNFLYSDTMRYGTNDSVSDLLLSTVLQKDTTEQEENKILHDPLSCLWDGTPPANETPPATPPSGFGYLQGLIKNTSEELLKATLQEIYTKPLTKGALAQWDSIINKSQNLTSSKEKTPSASGKVSLPTANVLRARNKMSIYYADDYTKRFNEKCAHQQMEANHAKKLALLEAEQTTKQRRALEKEFRENLGKRRFIGTSVYTEVDDCPTAEVSEPELPPLTEEHNFLYNDLINGPLLEVLITKFSLDITRNDIRTLTGSCWLSGQIINFYMNLLTDRSQRKQGELPSVYAMNTFFVPRLLQDGHNAVKRWTRKVDLFSKDIIPVPVHVGGVHWCMAIIHMKNKTISYYDSMGKSNQLVLNALETYLREESLDKRNIPFDTSDFIIDHVRDVPQQMNGSDCGVFSCMFAEYVTRNKPLNFSQQDMDYFRIKMVLEICGGELWL